MLEWCQEVLALFARMDFGGKSACRRRSPTLRVGYSAAPDSPSQALRSTRLGESGYGSRPAALPILLVNTHEFLLGKPLFRRRLPGGRLQLGDGLLQAAHVLQ